MPPRKKPTFIINTGSLCTSLIERKTNTRLMTSAVYGTAWLPRLLFSILHTGSHIWLYPCGAQRSGLPGNFRQCAFYMSRIPRIGLQDKPVSYTHLTLPTNREV